MKAVTNLAINVREDNLCLKEPSGWFAAGASFRRALRTLSDGAFKLFAHLCLEADRRTGRFEAVQGELAKAIGKSRRIVGKYIEELEHKEVCTIRSGTNQYARTCFEIRDEYWPYRRTQEVEGADGPVRNAYVDAIKSSFVAIGCTIGKFSARDAQFAQDLQQRGIPLEKVQDAMLWAQRENIFPGSTAVRLSRSEAWLTSRHWSRKSRSGHFPRITENIFEERSCSSQGRGRRNPQKGRKMGDA
jgi:hypothetical protein